MAVLSFGMEKQRAKLAARGPTFCSRSGSAPMPVIFGGVAATWIKTDCNGVDAVFCALGF